MFDFQAYSFLLFIYLIITIFIWARFFKSSGAKSRYPPTPFGLPIIGHLHLHLFNPIPHQVFRKLSFRHGPIFRVFMGSVLCSPEIAKEFLKTNEEAFSNRPLSSTQHDILYGTEDFVFAPYGPYWKFMRKIVMSELLNHTTLDLLSSVRHDEINRFSNALSEYPKTGKFVDLSGEFVKLTNNVISRMAMSKRCTDKEGEVVKMLADITELMSCFNISDYVWLLKTLDLQGLGRKVKDIHSRYDLIIERIWKEHDEARKHNKTGQVVKDLLDILLDIEQDESSEIKLSRENIKAFILNLLVAGTETSATTLEWAMSELINHPNIMKKAAHEIQQVDMEEKSRLSLTRANPLVCVPVARLDPIPFSM